MKYITKYLVESQIFKVGDKVKNNFCEICEIIKIRDAIWENNISVKIIETTAINPAGTIIETTINKLVKIGILILCNYLPPQEIIGDVSLDAVWVKEGMKFESEDVEISNDSIICKIKCPTCKTFH